MINYELPNQILISAMLGDQPSNVFTTAKSRYLIAYISPTKRNHGLGTGANVFYDLTLGRESLFRNFLRIELIIDFWQILPCSSKGKFDDFE
jgi:hypothetical protein